LAAVVLPLVLDRDRMATRRGLGRTTHQVVASAVAMVPVLMARVVLVALAVVVLDQELPQLPLAQEHQG
jgi:hypothetical protein